MKLSALLAPLIAAKAPHDQIMAVIVAFEAQQSDALDQRRRADAERQAAKRERDKSRDITLRHSDRSLTSGGDARVEDKSLTSEIEPQEEKKVAPASPSPRHQLEAVLDPERADAILEHRKRIKAPLTSRAAKLLAGELAKCPDPRAAADLILLKGWRGFEAKWVLGEQAPRAGPQTPRINPTLEAALRLQGEIDAVSPSEIEGNHPPPRLVAIGGRSG